MLSLPRGSRMSRLRSLHPFHLSHRHLSHASRHHLLCLMLHWYIRLRSWRTGHLLLLTLSSWKSMWAARDGGTEYFYCMSFREYLWIWNHTRNTGATPPSSCPCPYTYPYHCSISTPFHPTLNPPLSLSHPFLLSPYQLTFPSTFSLSHPHYPRHLGGPSHPRGRIFPSRNYCCLPIRQRLPPWLYMSPRHPRFLLPSFQMYGRIVLPSRHPWHPPSDSMSTKHW